ncbi:Hint domain-containing protein [Celeribacter sp.]|uniref:Hint domain-containing protein n=1 Tax=Celeribacter sp. TaxID=1890673 RepID=UPI003A8F4F92
MTQRGARSNKSERKAPCGQGPAKLRIEDILPDHSAGIAAGTLIVTADGVLPVEYLEPGDRVVTRSGMRALLDVDTPAPHRFALKFKRAEVIYADGVMVNAQTGQALVI